MAARPPSNEVNAEAARRPGICPGPLVADSTRPWGELFLQSAAVFAQDGCSADVMQSCGCQRPETILVIRVNKMEGKYAE